MPDVKEDSSRCEKHENINCALCYIELIKKLEARGLNTRLLEASGRAWIHKRK